MVTVVLSPQMKPYTKYGHKIEVKWDGGTIRNLLETLEVDSIEIGNVLVNGSLKMLDDEITDNCEVILLPVMCGG
ncbi:MoaD/ThiS family protein [Desulfitibacter alkalitolerans]|uniref:MoaD/ThiS family protein n=1 Tax=Desulfitibacter alkalitolerans TaxID=264641 RepID=UPI000483004D|nr:MoaD/ThiS family protein [Desulfitibacter alkalitolerans]